MKELKILVCVFFFYEGGLTLLYHAFYGLILSLSLFFACLSLDFLDNSPFNLMHSLFNTNKRRVQNFFFHANQ